MGNNVNLRLVGTHNPSNSYALTEQILRHRSPSGSCARIGQRSLNETTKPLRNALSNAPEEAKTWLDDHNLELAHEHIVFEGSDDNIGYGPGGLFTEHVEDYDYTYDATCYDPATMREAVYLNRFQSFYIAAGRNCQTWVEKVRNTYYAIANKASTE